jgi:hypothetical protein
VAARVAELRLLFVAVSVVSLGAGYYLAYRRRGGSRLQRMALWVATPLTVLFWLLPLVTR